MDQTLIQEILEVVEQAAIASAKLSGKGLKDEADAAAVEAMRKRMGTRCDLCIPPRLQCTAEMPVRVIHC